MKAIVRSPKFWMVAVLLGLLAMRAGCPPGIRRAVASSQKALRLSPAVAVPKPVNPPR